MGVSIAAGGFVIDRSISVAAKRRRACALVRASAAPTVAPGEAMRGMAPYHRRRFLASDEAIKILDGALRDAELKRLDREFVRLASLVPSGSWLRAADVRQEQFPPGGAQTGMVLSLISGRYTPPIALDLEDELDGLGILEAEFYDRPESPSAKVIREIREAKAKPLGGKW